MNVNDTDKRNRLVLPFFSRHREPTRAGVRRDGRPASVNSNRLKFLDFLPDHYRSHAVAFIGEFLGTLLFLFGAFAATSVANLASPPAPDIVGAASNPGQLIYISLAFGFSLAVNAWIFSNISGGLFNPSVVLSLCLSGALPYVRGVVLFLAELAGSVAAAGLCSAILPGDLATVRVGLGGGMSVVRGLFLETAMTFQLVLSIMYLAVQKSAVTPIAPLGIGLSLFLNELAGLYWTGAACNPLRALAPSLISGTFHSYHWIYWVSGIIAAILAALFYGLLKSLNYETSATQIGTPDESAPFNPNNDHSAPTVSFAPEEYAMEEGHQKEASVSAPFRDPGTGPVDVNNIPLEARPVISSTDKSKPSPSDAPFDQLSSPDRNMIPAHNVSHGQVSGAGTGVTPGTPTKSAMRPGSATNHQNREHGLKSNTYENSRIGSGAM